MKSLAILGVFYDGYKDTWEDFFNLFNKNWKSCPYPKYVVNNSCNINKDGFTIINAGENAEFSKKIQVAIQTIKEDYVLVLLEDFVLGKEIKSDPLIEIMGSIEKLDADYYVMPICEFNKSYRSSKKALGKNVFFLDNKDGYTLNCQPSIWKKDFLGERIGKLNFNAWVFEGVYRLDCDKRKPNYLEKCFCDKREPLNLVHTIVQGKIIPSAYKALVKKGYVLKCSRQQLTFWENLKRKVRLQLSRILPHSLKKLLKSKSSSSVLDSYKEEIQKVRKDLFFEQHEMVH